jgi:transposase InsO family protein
MHRRKWNATPKAMIVLEGLKGKPVAELCNDHQISQAQYYQWRDQFLAHAAQAFEVHERSQREARLARENVRLKALVGELTAEGLSRRADAGVKKKRRAAGLRRQPAVSVARRNQGLLERIRELKAAHPFGGYRRLWAYLRFVEQQPVNKKRILRLLREHHLLVQPNLKLKAKRTPSGRQPRPTQPTEWWGIAMTKVLVEGFGWVDIVVVLDWYTKMIVGYYAGMQCKSQHWLSALDMAVNRQFPAGARGQGLSLMSDNGCQPTSTAFLRACGTLGLQQAFTSSNARRGMRTPSGSCARSKKSVSGCRNGPVPSS